MTGRTCQDCPASLPPDSPPRRKYCPDCATERVRESKRRWHRSARDRAGKGYRQYSYGEIPPGTLTCGVCGGLLDSHPLVNNPCRDDYLPSQAPWPPSAPRSGRIASKAGTDPARG